MWQLYSPTSARDRGTLYQLRTLLDRRNVVCDPQKNFNACHDFLDTVVDGYIVAAAIDRGKKRDRKRVTSPTETCEIR